MAARSSNYLRLYDAVLQTDTFVESVTFSLWYDLLPTERGMREKYLEMEARSIACDSEIVPSTSYWLLQLGMRLAAGMTFVRFSPDSRYLFAATT